MTRAMLDRELAFDACHGGLNDPARANSELEQGTGRLAARWGRAVGWLHDGVADGVN